MVPFVRMQASVHALCIEKVHCLKIWTTICNEESFWLTAEVTEAYWKLVKVFRTPTEIMEIFKLLIYTKDNVQPLIDGSTKKPVYAPSRI